MTTIPTLRRVVAYWLDLITTWARVSFLLALAPIGTGAMTRRRRCRPSRSTAYRISAAYAGFTIPAPTLGGGFLAKNCLDRNPRQLNACGSNGRWPRCSYL